MNNKDTVCVCLEDISRGAQGWYGECGRSVWREGVEGNARCVGEVRRIWSILQGLEFREHGMSNPKL